MVLGLNPEMLLVNAPVPVPSVVRLPDTSGLDVVAQHTPLALTVPPPSLLMLPPLTAAVDVIELTAVLVSVGKTMGHEPHVGTPLQYVKVCPVVPGATVTQALPFQ